MAVIHIDGKTYDVDGSDNLLSACLSLGIDVPYFCYHPALGSVGSCRQCAVKQYNNAEDYQAGKGRLVMSCMVAPSDDMYISVDDDEAKAFRKSIVEYLMTNHPHDCPTCEEGGHCHLQDMTYMSGHHRRRYRFTKRTHHNQELGPFIAHEMNRCIACYRCVRFYQDYAGGDDLGVYASNNRVYFGRPEDGQFDSEFSGNLTEVCPTGVFTDKTHSERYNRKWDMQYAPSICHGCSAGCNISAGERYGELRRIENRYNHDVNGYFLCDRGRFGYGYVNRADRPVQAIERINDKQVKINIDYALDETVKRLKGKKIIGIGSPRASLETNFSLKKLVGSDNFSTGLNATQQHLVQGVIDILQDSNTHNVSMREIETHDAVWVIGEDITQTSPRIALAVRQAAKNKAKKLANDVQAQQWLAEPVKRVAQNQLSPVYITDVHDTKLSDISKLSLSATPDDLLALVQAVIEQINTVTMDKQVLQNEHDEGKLWQQLQENNQHSQQNNTNDNTNDNTSHDEMQKTLAILIAHDLLMAQKPLIISGVSLGDDRLLTASQHLVRVLTDKRMILNTVKQPSNQSAQPTSLTQPTSLVQPTKDKELTAKPNHQLDEQADNKHQDHTLRQDIPIDEHMLRMQYQASIYLVVPEVNSVGVVLLGGQDIDTLLATDFEAVVVVENQLTDAISDVALKKLLTDNTVICLDHQRLDWHQHVDIVLPAASFAEADGTVVSAEGRAQRFFQAYDPNYYHPLYGIKEGWRWLHAVATSLNDEPFGWTQLDDVIDELIATHSHLQGIKDAAPNADFRISGLKVAREPRRYSGRTAMRASLSVHEPMQPKDLDTALTFSMEGYVGDKTPSGMIPFAWSAGWNSPQAWNKYQNKVGGKLKAGDVGVCLFANKWHDNTADAHKTDKYGQAFGQDDNFANQSSVNTQQHTNQNGLLLVPIYDLYASSPMAKRSAVVQSQLIAPSYRINTQLAKWLGIKADDMLTIINDSQEFAYPIHIDDSMADGCIGFIANLMPIINHRQAFTVKVQTVHAPQLIDNGEV